MSGDVVARARESLQGVTEGPWEIEPYTDRMSGETTYSLLEIEQYRGYRNNVGVGTDKALAEFIAAARSLVPELVAEVEKLRFRLEVSNSGSLLLSQRDDAHVAEVEKLRGALETIRDTLNNDELGYPAQMADIRGQVHDTIGFERAGIEP